MGVFERVEGYDLKECSDAKVFLIDVSTKTIEELTEQPLVVGEDRSQFIRFEIDRYVDGIDLSCTKISMIYANEDGAGDKSKVINVERSEDKLRFGWLVPGLALSKPGTLTFSVKFENDGYILRTRPLDTEIFDTIVENYIPEPVEKEWYIEIQEKCRDALDKAETLFDTVDGIADSHIEHIGNTDIHISSAERTKWNDAKTHAEEEFNKIRSNLSVLETNLGDLKKEEVDKKIESEVAIDFSQEDTPQFQKTIDDVLNDVNELKSDLIHLENLLIQIQDKLNQGTIIDNITVNEINDMIVSYFENKTVSEVEA